MQRPFAGIPILPAEKEVNFFDLAQILGPLPNAWPRVRHALWTEVVKKILIIGRFLRYIVLFFS